MNYSLRQLRVFVTVAHARSFSRAGDIIGLSQSAVSHSVKELELQTGVRLLDRTTREVVLTEAGQQLAARLERLLDELNNTLRDAGRVGQQLSGTVRVAASQTISAHLIPQCIAQSNRLYPEIDFMLHDRPQQWVLESIRHGEVDFGIVIDPGPASDYSAKRSCKSHSFYFAAATTPGQPGKIYPGLRCKIHVLWFRTTPPVAAR